MNIKADRLSAEHMRAWGFPGACKHFGKADQARALFCKQKFSISFS